MHECECSACLYVFYSTPAVIVSKDNDIINYVTIVLWNVALNKETITLLQKFFAFRFSFYLIKFFLNLNLSIVWLKFFLGKVLRVKDVHLKLV